MSVFIRQASPSDAPLWIQLLEATVGKDYPAKEVYDAGWVAKQLEAGQGHDTFVAETGGEFLAAISFLPSIATTKNPVLNLGRCFFRPESLASGAAAELIDHVLCVADKNQQIAVARVPVADTMLQSILEKAGFVCVGFQPVKHLHPVRQSILFYVHSETAALESRQPASHSISQASELSTQAAARLGIEATERTEDGVMGYPLQSLITVTDTNAEQFEAHCRDAAARRIPAEISSGSHRGSGWLRVTPPTAHAVLAHRGSDTTAGVLWLHDEQDRCVRLADAFSADVYSLGPLLFRVVSLAQDKLNVAYVEMDVLATATRLLKTAEQLGFVPVACFPGFYQHGSRRIDVIKLVKLNVPHASEPVVVSEAAAVTIKTVESSFELQKAGVGIVNLLRGLAMFGGLGDGELRKMASLFQQKLIRPGETIFQQGGAGDEAFIVLRGQVEILIDEPARKVAVIEPGQVFGEQAFLDGSLRTATAQVKTPTILLVIQRTAFHELAAREPHLGLVVMRNVAVELSTKLRKTTAVWVADRKA